LEMEMHSQASLYEIHGIGVRRRRRSRPIVRRLVAGILAFVSIVKRAIEAELAARRATAELTELDDPRYRAAPKRDRKQGAPALVAGKRYRLSPHLSTLRRRK